MSSINDFSEASIESVEDSSESDSRPSVHTTSFHQQSFQATETNNQMNSNVGDATVSADQERQVLLLMLLAQVCALHDPTPKTFTIHVVELFERGILDRESIHFLFELGLVPNISPTITRAVLAAAEGNFPANSSSDDPVTTAACNEIANELALTTNATANTTAKLAAVFAASSDPQRSAEAYAIRATLAQYEQLQHNRSGKHAETIEAPANVKPWEAKHFPLSLSRYQREFNQIALLASGSFGQVFQAVRKMDGCHYAIKKVDFDATGYSNETIEEVVREVECLAKVSDHPNVVRYYTSWLEPSWMTGGQTVDNVASTSSPSGSPTHVQRRREQRQRLLLTNQLQDLIQPGTPSDAFPGCRGAYVDASYESYESTRFSTRYGVNSFESKESSSGGMWQRPRRFSFGSDVDSSDQSWESYDEQSLADLQRATFDEEESSSSIQFLGNGRRSRKAGNRKANETNGAKAPYRYQISLYIQMQLCHPASLADWIRERNSRVPESNYEERVAPALEIFEQIVKGLAHVHDQGIIHRDLKPANIFASSDGQIIKIGDFGLSKQLRNINSKKPSGAEEGTSNGSPTEEKQTAEHVSMRSHHVHFHNAKKGAIIQKSLHSTAITRYDPKVADPLLTAGIGTRSYAAPEQLTSKSYSTAADMFSLGLIFLELVCCFETEHERLHNFQQCRQQEGVQSWLTDHYPEIANIILACTSQDPNMRPSANAVLGMLSARRIQDISPSNMAAAVGESVNHASHSAKLQKTLEEKNEELEQQKQELAEKDREIERLRREMERMRSGSISKESSTIADSSEQGDID
eukprot:CAMPEP_0176003228 /NCGR_PEP_ID=MMETSP0120_2-20121206/1066_1 /TAXON_ID=160619 /ORGANISM="Kryptoperidinium foliaceum, Strain CCMP 1326" /LENGTH=809 /DNA_ID=CAMNT_0017335865 /DNA_START=278 /DNA_END=2707 /DNA_ORIENTATION=+